MTRHPDDDSQLAIFQKLCGLVGQWRDTDSSTEVDYRLSANGSVLVETWRWPERNIEALTLYHMDDAQLMATHYCPAGNQPRLLLDASADRSVITFKFHSATNLPDPDVDHNIEFWFKIDSPESFTRSETYTENGVRDVQQGIFRRRA